LNYPPTLRQTADLHPFPSFDLEQEQVQVSDLIKEAQGILADFQETCLAKGTEADAVASRKRTSLLKVHYDT
jgi:hypothetical protein